MCCVRTKRESRKEFPKLQRQRFLGYVEWRLYKQWKGRRGWRLGRRKSVGRVDEEEDMDDYDHEEEKGKKKILK